MDETFPSYENHEEPVAIDLNLVVGRLQEFGVPVELEDFIDEDENDILGAIAGYAELYDLDMDEILPQVTPIESRDRTGDTQ